MPGEIGAKQMGGNAPGLGLRTSGGEEDAVHHIFEQGGGNQEIGAGHDNFLVDFTARVKPLPQAVGLGKMVRWT
jgi:hypothetical protein